MLSHQWSSSFCCLWTRMSPPSGPKSAAEPSPLKPSSPMSYGQHFKRTDGRSANISLDKSVNGKMLRSSTQASTRIVLWRRESMALSFPRTELVQKAAEANAKFKVASRRAQDKFRETDWGRRQNIETCLEVPKDTGGEDFEGCCRQEVC